MSLYPTHPLPSRVGCVGEPSRLRENHNNIGGITDAKKDSQPQADTH